MSIRMRRIQTRAARGLIGADARARPAEANVHEQL